MLQRYTPTQLLILGGVLLLFLYSFAPTLFSGGLFDMDGLAWRVIGLVIGISVHEACHALAAVRLGDPTPRMMGRLTLNPLAHLDPMGTLLIFVAGFGWGKPVTFNPRNLRGDPHTGSAIVSVAGPVSNLIVAFLAAIPLRGDGVDSPMLAGLLGGIVIVNVSLAVFNLIPVPPLDGFGLLTGLLPRSFVPVMEPLRQYGPLILLALVFLPSLTGGVVPNVLFMIMGPAVRFLLGLML